jgi:hypothetical protein
MTSGPDFMTTYLQGMVKQQQRKYNDMFHKQTPQQEDDSDLDDDNEDNDSLLALMQAQHTKQAMKAIEPEDDDDETVEQELMQDDEPQLVGGTSALAGGSPALAEAGGGPQLINPAPVGGAGAGQRIDAGDNDDDQDMSYGTDPVLEAMFAKAGGLGRDPRAGHADDADEEQAPGPGQGRTAAAEPERKLGWGSRIWSGIKGVGQLALSPLIALGGLMGDGLHSLRLRSMQKKLRHTQRNAPTEASSARERDAYARQLSNLHTNMGRARMGIGSSRRAWTQRNMLDNFTRAFTGRKMKMKTERVPFFTGGMFHGYE